RGELAGGGLLPDQLGLRGATIENLAHPVEFFLGELPPGLVEPAFQKGDLVDGNTLLVEPLEVADGGLLGLNLTLEGLWPKQCGQPQQEQESHGAPSIQRGRAIVKGRRPRPPSRPRPRPRPRPRKRALRPKRSAFRRLSLRRRQAPQEGDDATGERL